MTSFSLQIAINKSLVILFLFVMSTVMYGECSSMEKRELKKFLINKTNGYQQWNPNKRFLENVQPTCDKKSQTCLDTNLIRNHFQVSIKQNHQNPAMSSNQAQPTADECKHFFQGKPWAIPKSRSANSLAKLCQNEIINEDNKFKKMSPVFATLFDTDAKIPLHSASKLELNSNYKLSRKDTPSSLWKRVSKALCTEPIGKPVMSEIIDETYMNKTHMDIKKCLNYQANDSDYRKNSQNLTRGHLEPRNTKNNIQYRQETTFTLTNVAPQYSAFNSGSWNTIESCLRELILKFYPNQAVYVVTGTEGAKVDNKGKVLKLKNRVTVPKYFWKAACYLDNNKRSNNNQKSGWAFAIKMENKNKNDQNKKIIDEFENLGNFIEEKFGFGNNLFGEECRKLQKETFVNQLTKTKTCSNLLEI